MYNVKKPPNQQKQKPNHRRTGGYWRERAGGGGRTMSKGGQSYGDRWKPDFSLCVLALRGASS